MHREGRKGRGGWALRSALALGLIAATGSQRFAGGAAAQGGPLPDLVVDEGVLQSSLNIQFQTFSGSSCAMQEKCIFYPGLKKLLRFTTRVVNLGNADFFLGNPFGNPLFQFSPCHGHYHFEGYADYNLVNLATGAKITGHKQGFCLLDSQQVVPGSPSSGYNCGFQGISAGWADVYGSSLDCQWVDITDVPPGNYLLAVEVNSEQQIPESIFKNNTGVATVTIP